MPLDPAPDPAALIPAEARDWPADVQAHLLTVMCDAPLLVALYDRDDVLRYGNPAFLQAYGLTAGTCTTWREILRDGHRRGVGARVDAPDFEAWLASAASRRGKLPHRAFETDLYDGRWIWMTETRSADGWMWCVGFDITELQAGERALRTARDLAQRAAQTDELTGISNRRHILEQLERLCTVPAPYAAASGPSACVGGIALLDLDHFKCINDAQGHHAGDAVLRHFAQLVPQVLRRDDGFGRVGGEEFLLVVRGAEAPDLNRLLLRLLDLVRQSTPLAQHPALRYTVSAGVTRVFAGDDPKHVYRQADAALYQAKAQGRDRLCWHDSARGGRSWP